MNLALVLGSWGIWLNGIKIWYNSPRIPNGPLPRGKGVIQWQTSSRNTPDKSCPWNELVYWSRTGRLSGPGLRAAVVRPELKDQLYILERFRLAISI